MKLWWAICLSTLTACASRPAPPVVSFADGVATYRGSLEPDSMDRLQAVVRNRAVTRLRISSEGGEVGGAIKIARWVHANGIDVEVDGECFSSCANYIFPAGRNKHIVGAGIVGWHGTLTHLLYNHDQKIKAVDAESLPYLHEMAAVERAFYADTGINSFTGWFGKVAPYNVYNIYFLAPDDMAYFGMERLHVRANYEQADLREYLREDARTIRLLKVDRAVTNASDSRWGAAR
jgi:hypothetical protein